MDDGDLGQALADCAEAIKWEGRAFCEQLTNSSPAKQRQARQHQHQLARWHDRRGVIFMIDGRVKEAIEDFVSAIGFDPQDSFVNRLIRAAAQIFEAMLGSETISDAIFSEGELGERVTASCSFTALNELFLIESFDATPWFLCAEDHELRALQQEGYCGHETAWSVVREAASTDLGVWILFELFQALPEAVEACSFACIVNREQAKAWMRVHRSQVLLEKQAEEPE
jgi:hypothetical protein